MLSFDALYLASSRRLWCAFLASKGPNHRDTRRYFNACRKAAAQLIAA